MKKSGSVKKDKILITQLGGNTKGYGETCYMYQQEDIEPKTKYGFDALCQLKKPNKLIIVGTKTSGWDDLVEWYAKKHEIAAPDTEENKWEKIAEFIKDCEKLEQVKVVIVPIGANDEEIYQYFDTVKAGVEDVVSDKNATEVMFDITNGFRSMPLYILMLVQYLALIKKTEIQYSCYYGMYEISRDNGGKTPIVNMSVVTELTEWINAISEFTNFGSVKKLYRCLEKEQNKENKEAVDQLIRIFKVFDYAINANNSFYLESSIREIQNIDVENIALSNQAKELLNFLKVYFHQQFAPNAWTTMYPRTFFLMQVSDMYIKQERIGQAAVAFQEGMVTYFIERHLKNDVLDGILGGVTDDLPKEFYEEFSRRDAVKSRFESKTRKYQDNKIYQNDKTDLVVFARRYYDIKKFVRNVSAHILSLEELPSVDEMRQWISISREMIMADMEKINSIFSDIFRGFYTECQAVYKNDSLFRELWMVVNGKWRIVEYSASKFEQELRNYSIHKKDNNARTAFWTVPTEAMQQLRKELKELKKMKN